MYQEVPVSLWSPQDVHWYGRTTISCFVFCNGIIICSMLKLVGLQIKSMLFLFILLSCEPLQRIPLKFDEEQGLWILRRELPVSVLHYGHYFCSYKSEKLHKSSSLWSCLLDSNFLCWQLSCFLLTKTSLIKLYCFSILISCWEIMLWLSSNTHEL